MNAYSMAVQADVRKRMSPPNRQEEPQISKELFTSPAQWVHAKDNRILLQKKVHQNMLYLPWGQHATTKSKSLKTKVRQLKIRFHDF